MGVQRRFLTMKSLIIFIGAFIAVNALESFNEHKVLRAQVETKEQADALVAIRDSYDFWTEIGIGRNVDIMASPEQLPALTKSLDMANIKHDDMILAKVCKGGCGNKPAMWIDGGIHAREWITHA